MTPAKFTLSGLYTVARDITSNRTGEEGNSQRMTLVFPNSMHDEHEQPGQGGHGGHGGEVHRAIIAFDPVALNNAKGSLPKDLVPVKEGDSAHSIAPQNTVAYHLSRWEVRLPVTKSASGAVEQRPVGYLDDENFSSTEEPTTCDVMGTFGSLSRLPDLERVTGGTFDTHNLMTPAPPRIEARVLLSGGTLRSVMSEKPLKHAYFEFYDRGGTVHIQPAVEDCLYEVEADRDGYYTLGFTRLTEGGSTEVHEIMLPVTGIQTTITSLPPARKMKSINNRSALAHFVAYYGLMKDHSREPGLRVLSRCDGDRIVHKMPPFPRAPQPIPGTGLTRRTVGNCSCLVASARAAFE